MKNILMLITCTDGIDNCLPYAQYISGSTKANLFILYVHQPIPPYCWLSADSYRAITHLQSREIDQKLKDLSLQVEKRANTNFSCVYAQGSFLDEILRIIEQQAMDLIITTTPEMDLLENMADHKLWSTTRKKLYPILVIPQKAIFSPIQHFMLIADFASHFNKDMLKPCMLLANACNAYIHILHLPSTEEKQKSSLEESITNQLADLYGNDRFVDKSNLEQTFVGLLAQQPYLIITTSHKNTSSMNVFEYTAYLARKITIPDNVPVLLLA